MARAILRPLLAAAFLLAAGVGSARADTDLAWIGALPGVSVRPVTAGSPGPKTVYQLSADLDATFASVRNGLTKRHWALVPGPAAPAGKKAPPHTLIAEKEGTRVKVVGSRAKGVSSLTVTVVRGLGTSGAVR
jgi:hypothetical protein